MLEIERGEYMIPARKTVMFLLKVLRQEIANSNTTQLHKCIAFLEISNYIKGFCYGNLEITSNGYKLVTGYLDRLCDKYNLE